MPTFPSSCRRGGYSRRAMPPFDTRLYAADLEWASLAFICFYAPAASIQRAPLATTGLIVSGQSDRRGPAARKVCNARERAQRRPLRDVSMLILGRDREAQPLPGATASGRTRACRRGEGPQTRCVGNLGNQMQFDEKSIYYFHQKGGTL